MASAIEDATITGESGTHEVSLSGVFTDADEDDLTVTASLVERERGHRIGRPPTTRRSR